MNARQYGWLCVLVAGCLGIAGGVGLELLFSEEQVSIQEEEMEMIGLYKCDFILIYKLHDNRDNVTCWLYRGGQGGGMSCIPDHMLTP